MVHHFTQLRIRNTIILLTILTQVLLAQTIERCTAGRWDVGNGMEAECWFGNTKETACLSTYGSRAFTIDWDMPAYGFLHEVGRWDLNIMTDNVNPYARAQYSLEIDKWTGTGVTGLYGWFLGPGGSWPEGSVEWYIVENWSAAGESHYGTNKGDVVIDGLTYTIYTQPMNQWRQWWSICEKKRTGGTISYAEHFAAWRAAGMPDKQVARIAFQVESGWSGATSGHINYTTFSIDPPTEGTPPSPPAAPGQLSTEALSSSAIIVSWKDNSQNENNFEIERKSENTPFHHLATIPANLMTYIDHGLASQTTYAYRIRAVNNAGNSLWSETQTITTKEQYPGEVLYAVNCGGETFTSEEGIIYAADRDYTDGNQYLWEVPVSGTAEEPVYQTERYGSDFTYEIPFENGTYEIILKFAENYITSPGGRIFTISADEQNILEKFDIFAQAGLSTAYDTSVSISVHNKLLRLSFSSETENAKINGIVVKSPEITSRRIHSDFPYHIMNAQGPDRKVQHYDLRGCRMNHYNTRLAEGIRIRQTGNRQSLQLRRSGKNQ